MSQILTPQPVTETLDGLEFITIPFPALHALGLMARLMKAFGPLGAIMGDDDDEDEKVDFSKVAGALAQLNPADAQSLALEILKSTYVWLDTGEGKGPKKVEITSAERFNTVFNGRIPTLFKVIGFVLKSNFAGFSDGDGSKSEPTLLQDK